MEIVEEIRNRIKHSGWFLREIPVRNNNEVVRWKVSAVKKDKSFSTEGTSLLSALENLGRILGLWRGK